MECHGQNQISYNNVAAYVTYEQTAQMPIELWNTLNLRDVRIFDINRPTARKDGY